MATEGKRLGLLNSLLILVLLPTGQLLAQDRPFDEPVQENESVSSRQTNEEMSYAMPASGRSLKDSVLQNPRNKVGFSVGVFGLYDRAELGKSQTQEYDSIEMMVAPTMFLNLGKRRTQFHADYRLEQRFFNEAENLGDKTFHAGNISLLYMPTRHWTITATDEVRSAPSDLLSLSGGFSPGLPLENPVGPGVSGYSYQRVFMNRGAAEISYALDRNTSVSFNGNSQIFRYENSVVSDTNAYNVGANLSRNLTRRLDASVGFVYGRYSNVSGSRNDEIRRLSGGLGYQINRHWRLHGNGGVEWVETPDFSHNPSYFSGAIGRTTDRSVFLMSYTRSSQYQLGTPELSDTQTVSLSFDKRLTAKSSLLLAGYYYRSKPYAESIYQNTFIAGTGFEYRLLRNIMLSLNGNYQYQDKAYVVEDSPSLKHLIIYAGVEIIVPGMSRR